MVMLLGLFLLIREAFPETNPLLSSPALSLGVALQMLVGPVLIGGGQSHFEQGQVQRAVFRNVHVGEHPPERAARPVRLECESDDLTIDQVSREGRRFVGVRVREPVEFCRFRAIDAPHPYAGYRAFVQGIGQVDVEGVTVDDANDAPSPTVVGGHVIDMRDEQPASTIRKTQGDEGQEQENPPPAT